MKITKVVRIVSQMGSGSTTLHADLEPGDDAAQVAIELDTQIKQIHEDIAAAQRVRDRLSADARHRAYSTMSAMQQPSLDQRWLDHVNGAVKDITASEYNDTYMNDPLRNPGNTRDV